MNEEMRDAQFESARKAMKDIVSAKAMVGRSGKTGDTARKLTEEDLKKLGGLPVEERLAKVRLVPHRPKKKFKNRSRY